MAATQESAIPPVTVADPEVVPPPVADARPRDVPVQETEAQEPGIADRRRSRLPGRVAAVIALVGMLLTLAATLGAARIDRNTEQRLLEGQTRQAASVLSGAIMLIEQPVEAALEVSGGAGGTPAFERFMGARVGDTKTFQSASLWVRQGGELRQVVAVGAPPVIAADSPQTQAQLRTAFGSPTTTVRFVTGQRNYVVYARADPTTNRAVYVERALPADRRSPVDKDSAFKELHYAIYLGRHVQASALTTTDLDPAALPLRGRTAREIVPFGNNVLVLTTKPRHHLGAPLSKQLPWLLLVGGLVLTAVAARAGQQLARGRQTAEEDASTITGLYERAAVLYAQQRELFVSLQRALLPHVNPTIPHVELASEYVAGARGLDIGGDWFSIIDLPGTTRFGFVVGDVSGRGVDAVAVMAHARFTIRAYLLDDDDPATVLEKCAPQFDILTDGHMTTVLVGVGDWSTGEVTLASAGHPPPVLITAAGTTYVDLTPGRPLGTGGGPYPTTTVTLPTDSILFCYTDGLVERRGEDIDVGLDRLAGVLAPLAGRPVDDVMSGALDALRHTDAADDIATLAIRWTGAR